MHLRQIQVGELIISSISDGYLDLDQRMFVGISQDALKKQLARTELDNLLVHTPVNVFLIKTVEGMVLVDTGSGQEYGTTAGQAIKNLHEIGVNPDQISFILLTHLHPDHVGGLLTPEGKLAFPNAILYVSSIEMQYWHDSMEEAKATEDIRPFFAIAKKMVAPYVALGRLKLFEAGERILSGVTTIKAFGHTPGHVGFLFQSQEDQILLWGDVVHTEQIEFENPEWYLVFDVDGAQGVETRKRLFKKAADERLLIGGAHLLGFGHVVNKKGVFAWMPVTP